MKKKNHPSYWIESNCEECGAHVGRLIWFFEKDSYLGRYTTRIVQGTCACVDINDHRLVTDDDIEEYEKREKAGEPTQ